LNPTQCIGLPDSLEKVAPMSPSGLRASALKPARWDNELHLIPSNLAPMPSLVTSAAFFKPWKSC